MTRSQSHQSSRRAFTAITPRQRAREVIATFVGVLERLESVTATRAGPRGARRLGAMEQRR